ncbi:MAG: 30S ribosomal protein S21 [Thermogutta sp.]|nr:30S ribosomal protein S21 [Thermogutta sp.]
MGPVRLPTNRPGSLAVEKPLSLRFVFGKGGCRVVKLILRESESIQEAVRRFRKLVERAGIKREMRRREYYEKPSEIRRRARLRAERRARRSRLMMVR